MNTKKGKNYSAMNELSALILKAPTLTGAYNMAYLATVLRTFAQISLWGTSDMPKTLYAIGFGAQDKKL